MTITYHGNVVDIKYSIGDTFSSITLPDGYSFEDILVLVNTGIYALGVGIPIPIKENTDLHFPPVNSHTPNTIKPLFDNTKEQRFTFLISKFGQIPDEHYFDTSFEPILVMGNDGKEYKVIPSDQFK